MTQLREHWGSRLGFILAAIGSAIGLGVLWKFPYTVGENGGGVFLLAYIICVIIIGIPLLIGELAIGRMSQRAAVGAFQVLAHKPGGWKSIGWVGVVASFLIMSFYSVIAGWGMSYVLMSLSGVYHQKSPQEVAGIFDVLSRSGSICVFWHGLFTTITMGIVLTGVRKGIEFWSKLMMRALFVILIGLLIYNMSLDGFYRAVCFMFCPDFSQFELSSVLEALGLAFFTLSLGQGIMISYGSYIRKKENLPQMACIIAFSVVVVAILSAMTMFPVVFTFDLAPEQGAGLIFKTLPYLFAQLPGALIVSTVFFTLFVFTALTSAIPFIEVVATNFMEVLGWSRKKAVISVAIATFLFGIPCALSFSDSMFVEWKTIYGIGFLDTIDRLVSAWLIPLAGLLTALFIGWGSDHNLLKAEFPVGTVWNGVYHVWYWSVRWVIPVFIIIIILQKTQCLWF